MKTQTKFYKSHETTIVTHMMTCNMNIPNDRKARVVNAISKRSLRPISFEDPLS